MKTIGRKSVFFLRNFNGCIFFRYHPQKMKSKSLYIFEKNVLEDRFLIFHRQMDKCHLTALAISNSACMGVDFDTINSLKQL